MSIAAPSARSVPLKTRTISSTASISMGCHRKAFALSVPPTHPLTAKVYASAMSFLSMTRCQFLAQPVLSTVKSVALLANALSAKWTISLEKMVAAYLQLVKLMSFSTKVRLSARAAMNLVPRAQLMAQSARLAQMVSLWATRYASNVRVNKLLVEMNV